VTSKIQTTKEKKKINLVSSELKAFVLQKMPSGKKMTQR
jgi:hypothetical protein